MKKEIDWEEVDRMSEEYLKKCTEFDKQIAEERKHNDYDLKKMNEEVCDFAKKHGIKTITIEELRKK